LAQRLSWAKSHGVRPPEFAIAEARQAGIRLDGVADSSAPAVAAKSCCAAKQRHNNGNYSHEPVLTESSQKIVTDVASDGAATKATNISHHVIGWRALGCRGQSLNWLAAVPALVADHLHATMPAPIVVWVLCIPLDIAGGVPSDPAVPPPKRA
jgi:hypothetical protein